MLGVSRAKNPLSAAVLEMSGQAGPPPVTVEDYHSDEDRPDPIHVNHVRTNNRHGRPSASHAADSKDGGGPASDSGYSSHAAATAASFDSNNIPGKVTDGHRQKSQSAPLYEPGLSPSKSRQRSTPYGFTPASSSRPTTKTERAHVQRAATPSDPRNQPTMQPMDRHRGCDCRQCRAAVKRDSMSPLETPWNVDFSQFQPSDPRGGAYLDGSYPYAAGSSGRYTEEELLAGAAMAPPARPVIPRSRPMSFHAGVSPSAREMYYDGVYAPTYAGDHGPPVAVIPYPSPSMPPTMSGVPQPTPIPAYYSHPMEYSYSDVHPYDHSRPVMPHRALTEQRPASARPVSMYGPPVIHDDYTLPTSSYVPTATRRPSTRDSDELSRHRVYRDRERAQLESERAQLARDAQAMPPPASKPSRRPSIRQSRTSHSSRELPRPPPAPIPSDAGATITTDPYRRSSARRESSSSYRSGSRRPSFPAESGERRSSETYRDGSERVRVESNTSRRRSTYEYQPRSPEKTRHLERSAEEYQSARARATSSQPLTNEALYQQQRIRRGAGSTSSRASGSLDGSEVKQSRNGSGATANIDNSGDGITMRFTPGTDVMFDFSGGMDGQTISLKPGQTGQQAELSIKSRKGYENRSTGTYSEYARSDQPPRESDDGRRTRDGRSGNHHRRASRVAREH